MLQIFKYNLKQLLHNRSELFWVILFPIILGSLFKAAFSNITAGEKFQAIPVAIVNEQGSMSDGFFWNGKHQSCHVCVIKIHIGKRKTI